MSYTYENTETPTISKKPDAKVISNDHNDKINQIILKQKIEYAQKQLRKAIIDTIAYKDILTFDKRSAAINSKLGLKYTDLNETQQALLLKLIKVYVNRYTHLFAESMLKDIQAAGLDNILFAWAGTTINQVGSPTYYRVQGPTFIIEYDNTQNNANHIHSVIRDLKNDFGGDALLNHYKQGHTQ